MARKQRIDSTAAAVEVMIRSARSIEPPAHAPLHGDAGPFWDEIIQARALSEWTDHDLSCASDLANTMAQLVENRRKLRAEGEVILSASGSPVTNPRVSVVQKLHTQVKSARLSLSIHGGSAGEARDVRNRRAIAKEIEDGNPLAGDDLLARPVKFN